MANDAGSFSPQSLTLVLHSAHFSNFTVLMVWKCALVTRSYLTSQKQHLHPVPLQGVVSCQFDMWKIFSHTTSLCIPWWLGAMGSMVWMSLWAWMILDSGVCSVSLPQITDGKFIEECVSEHNRARSSVSPAASNMLYMVGMAQPFFTVFCTFINKWCMQW